MWGKEHSYGSCWVFAGRDDEGLSCGQAGYNLFSFARAVDKVDKDNGIDALRDSRIPVISWHPTFVVTFVLFLQVHSSCYHSIYTLLATIAIYVPCT